MAQRQQPSTSVKHQNFVKEPMGNKPVNHLPGIGQVASARMNERNITQASQVYGKYLVESRNPVAFENWMKNDFNVDRNRARQCSNAVDSYYKQFN
ncbi:barrier-to-autointegration factor-like [Photinus pyralis]|uniref:barrier-to-autointegration factor-like n=1 Tax=Photinus pyralis TaxID=7054 RepID=UPI00126718E1|nr:barrier-to-autointegration factor-like [Photinus pyralis]